MYIASAYPNSALGAPTMVLIALVVAGSLAAWLGLVFLADRQPRGRRGQVGLPIAPVERGELEEQSPGSEPDSRAA
jgi:hypothetical protein